MNEQMNTDNNVAETKHRLSFRLAATAPFCDSLNVGQLCVNPKFHVRKTLGVSVYNLRKSRTACTTQQYV
jgi:hypothetical protein